MKLILIVLFSLFAFSSWAKAIPLTCTTDKSFYQAQFEIETSAETPKIKKIQLFNKYGGGLKSQGVVNCEKSDPTQPPKIPMCWVLFGPDGGINFSLIEKKNEQNPYTVNLVPFGPTGNGATEVLICH